MRFTRRNALASGLFALASIPRTRAASAGRGMGVVIHSFPIRVAQEKGADRSISDPFRLLAYAKERGLTSIQVGVGVRSEASAGELRDACAAAGVALEGIVSLPKAESDSARFEAEIVSAKRAGASIVRSVMLSGRRYESFDNAAEFRRFAEKAIASLKLGVPIVSKHGVQLAIENHKDWRADDLVRIIKGLGSDHVGICVDLGNSMALLEDAATVVETLAPLAFTTHFKDMATEPYADGFLLAEVPLGLGRLPLVKMAETLRRANPEIRFNLEMITRDPLKVPCLTSKYWATFPDLPGRFLAATLDDVRSHPPRRPLQRPGAMSAAERLKLEEENLDVCFAFAKSLPGG